MARKPQADRLRQLLADQVIEAMIPFIPGWVKTLGQAGSPGNKQVSPATRVTAAKTGIELVTKFMSSGTSVGGEDLLKKLQGLEDSPTPTEDDDNDDDSAPNPDGTAGDDWTEDPDLGSQEADMEPG